MAIAIHTKYISATNTKPARIRASARGGDMVVKMMVTYDHEGDAHLTAAKAMRDLYWPGQELMLAGCTLDGAGDVYTVFPRKV